MEGSESERAEGRECEREAEVGEGVGIRDVDMRRAWMQVASRGPFFLRKGNVEYRMMNIEFRRRFEGSGRWFEEFFVLESEGLESGSGE